MEPWELEQLAERACEAFQAGNHLLGLALTDQLVEADPDTPVFRCWRAHALLLGGHPTEAVREAREAVRHGPKLYQSHLSLACAAAEARQYDEAQKAFERAVELSGRDPHLLIEYANFMAFERGPLPGETAALDALRARPRSANAWAALGMAQLRQRRLTESESSLRRALELDPHNPRGQVAMTTLLNATGRHRQAVALASLMDDDPRTRGYADSVRREAFRRETLRRRDLSAVALGASVTMRFPRPTGREWLVPALLVVLMLLTVIAAVLLRV